MDTNIEKVSGKKGVVIREDKYGIEVLTMRNGFQWFGMSMDAELIDMLEQAIVEFKRTQASPASVPEGWKLVPVEATKEIEQAFEHCKYSQCDYADSYWDAMLAAAPTPPVSEDRWLPIETAPKDGIEVWCFNGEHCVMRWISGEGYALWVYVDPLLSDADPEPEQPSHWMPLPEAPAMQEDKP